MAANYYTQNFPGAYCSDSEDESQQRRFYPQQGLNFCDTSSICSSVQILDSRHSSDVGGSRENSIGRHSESSVNTDHFRSSSRESDQSFQNCKGSRSSSNNSFQSFGGKGVGNSHKISQQSTQGNKFANSKGLYNSGFNYSVDTNNGNYSSSMEFQNSLGQHQPISESRFAHYPTPSGTKFVNCENGRTVRTARGKKIKLTQNSLAIHEVTMAGNQNAIAHVDVAPVKPRAQKQQQQVRQNMKTFIDFTNLGIMSNRQSMVTSESTRLTSEGEDGTFSGLPSTKSATRSSSGLRSQSRESCFSNFSVMSRNNFHLGQNRFSEASTILSDAEGGKNCTLSGFATPMTGNCIGQQPPDKQTLNPNTLAVLTQALQNLKKKGSNMLSNTNILNMSDHCMSTPVTAHGTRRNSENMGFNGSTVSIHNANGNLVIPQGGFLLSPQSGYLPTPLQQQQELIAECYQTPVQHSSRPSLTPQQVQQNQILLKTLELATVSQSLSRISIHNSSTRQSENIFSQRNSEIETEQRPSTESINPRASINLLLPVSQQRKLNPDGVIPSCSSLPASVTATDGFRTLLATVTELSLTFLSSARSSQINATENLECQDVGKESLAAAFSTYLTHLQGGCLACFHFHKNVCSERYHSCPSNRCHYCSLDRKMTQDSYRRKNCHNRKKQKPICTPAAKTIQLRGQLKTVVIDADQCAFSDLCFSDAGREWLAKAFGIGEEGLLKLKVTM